MSFEKISADIIAQEGQYHSVVVEMLRNIHMNVMNAEAKGYNPQEKKDHEQAAAIGIKYLTAYARSVGFTKKDSEEEMRKSLDGIMQDENGELTEQDRRYVSLLVTLIKSDLSPHITLKEIPKTYR